MMPFALLAAAVTLPAGQDHSGHAMPGMAMPPPAKPVVRRPAAKPPAAKPPVAKPPVAKRPAAKRPAPKRTAPEPAPVDHSRMDHSQMDPAAPPPADPHAGHDMTGNAAGAPDAPRLGTDLPPGNAPAPPVPMPHYADRIWNPVAMARARDVMMRDEGGGQRLAWIMVDIAEIQMRGGGESWRWEGEGWFGGDIDRFVVKTEGEGAAKVGSAEIQALYSRAIGPYFNLQAGIRHDLRPTPGRTFAVVGVEGLAPYWFEVEAAAFVSTKGELLGRVAGYYDQRLTQRWIVQPRAELNLSARNVRAIGIGSGLTSAELGLRLRYEVAREFAPYVGVSWERKVGGTRRFARADGEDSGGVSVVVGVRAWF